jgi:hypothetical protein
MTNDLLHRGESNWRSRQHCEHTEKPGPWRLMLGELLMLNGLLLCFLYLFDLV